MHLQQPIAHISTSLAYYLRSQISLLDFVEHDRTNVMRSQTPESTKHGINSTGEYNLSIQGVIDSDH